MAADGNGGGSRNLKGQETSCKDKKRVAIAKRGLELQLQGQETSCNCEEGGMGGVEQKLEHCGGKGEDV